MRHTHVRASLIAHKRVAHLRMMENEQKIVVNFMFLFAGCRNRKVFSCVDINCSKETFPTLNSQADAKPNLEED